MNCYITDVLCQAISEKLRTKICGWSGAVILLGYSVPPGIPLLLIPLRNAAAYRLQEVFVKLLTKFNLVLVVVFGLGIYLISHFAYNFLMEDARRQVLQ